MEDKETEVMDLILVELGRIADGIEKLAEIAVASQGEEE